MNIKEYVANKKEALKQEIATYETAPHFVIVQVNDDPASNAYIKTPFFFEGIILGLFGSLIPIALCGYGYIFMYKKLEGHLFTPIISLVSPEHLLLEVVILILIIAVAVGAFGSYRAVKKYLKI